MDKFVLYYQESDGCHYFIDVPIFIESESEEFLYCELHDLVTKKSNELIDILKKEKCKYIVSTFNEFSQGNEFTYRERSLVLKEFAHLDADGKLNIQITITKYDDYFNENKL